MVILQGGRSGGPPSVMVAGPRPPVPLCVRGTADRPATARSLAPRKSCASLGAPCGPEHVVWVVRRRWADHPARWRVRLPAFRRLGCRDDSACGAETDLHDRLL